jgi:antitoxin CptB
MSKNKEDLKNKIIYRASYRGTKEMDILMLSFVKSIINEIDDDYLETLDKFINMNDETLISIKNKETFLDKEDAIMIQISQKFQKFKM